MKISILYIYIYIYIDMYINSHKKYISNEILPSNTQLLQNINKALKKRI